MTVSHGMTGSPEYNSYHAMMQRCYYKKGKYYKRYGGRGIRVCPKWLGPGGFERFYADMGPKPKGTSLDRKNNNLNYTPSNCRWATKREQDNNRSSNRRLTFNGKTMTTTEWARELGIRPLTLFTRLQRGWAVKRALSTAPRYSSSSYYSSD